MESAILWHAVAMAKRAPSGHYVRVEAATHMGMQRLSKRSLLLVVALLLIGGGSLISLVPFNVSDTSCGQVAWDASRDGVCADEMSARTVAAVVLLGLGALALGAFFRWHLPALMVAAALALAALGMNRLLEPTDARQCGSVLNRHRTYEAQHEAACDALLAPQRDRGAVALFSAGAIALIAAATARRRNQAP